MNWAEFEVRPFAALRSHFPVLWWRLGSNLAGYSVPFCCALDLSKVLMLNLIFFVLIPATIFYRLVVSI
jgi:hypothetical protein